MTGQVGKGVRVSLCSSSLCTSELRLAIPNSPKQYHWKWWVVGISLVLVDLYL